MSISDWVVLFFASLLLLNIILSVFKKKSTSDIVSSNFNQLIAEQFNHLILKTNTLNKNQLEIIELLKVMVAKQ